MGYLVAYLRHSRDCSLAAFCNKFGYEDRYCHWARIARIKKNFTGILDNVLKAGFNPSQLTWNQLDKCKTLEGAVKLRNKRGAHQRWITNYDPNLPVPVISSTGIVRELIESMILEAGDVCGVPKRVIWHEIDRAVQEAFAAIPKYQWKP